MMNQPLWTAIFGLFRLLNDGTIAEAAYQEFLEANPVVFEVLGFSAAKSFEKRSGNRLPFDSDRDYQPEPDFICARRARGEVVVFEIKTPVPGPMLTSRADGQREKFRADVESYISQTTEYIEFIQGSGEARECVGKALDVERVVNFSGVLLYGRSASQELASIAQATARRTPSVEIVTFDALLERLIEAFAVSRPDVILNQNMVNPGWTLWTNIVLPRVQLNPRAVILSLGAPDGPRITLEIVEGEQRAVIVDDTGRTHVMRYYIPIEGPCLLKLEASSRQDLSFFVFSVGLVEVDVRSMLGGSSFTPNIEYRTIGAEHDGSCGSCMMMGSMGFVDKTLNVYDRLNLLYFYERNTPERVLKFSGSQFLTGGPRRETGPCGEVQESNEANSG